MKLPDISENTFDSLRQGLSELPATVKGKVIVYAHTGIVPIYKFTGEQVDYLFTVDATAGAMKYLIPKIEEYFQNAVVIPASLTSARSIKEKGFVKVTCVWKKGVLF